MESCSSAKNFAISFCSPVTCVLRLLNWDWETKFRLFEVFMLGSLPCSASWDSSMLFPISFSIVCCPKNVNGTALGKNCVQGHSLLLIYQILIYAVKSSGEARRKLMVVLIRDVVTGEWGGVRPPNFRTWEKTGKIGSLQCQNLHYSCTIVEKTYSQLFVLYLQGPLSK